MKYRNGFVSNSSTCSFVLVGIKLTNDQINKLLEKYNVTSDNLFNKQFGDNIITLAKDICVIDKDNGIYGFESGWIGKLKRIAYSNGRYQYVSGVEISSDEISKVKNDLSSILEENIDIKVIYGHSPISDTYFDNHNFKDDDGIWVAND
jgi:hypothetical protein